MHVAINTLFLIPGEVGGSETYVRETLLAIAQQHPDCTLSFVTNKENDTYFKEHFAGFAQCGFHSLPIRASNRYVRILTEQIRLPWLLRAINPDVLWSPGYTMPLWAPCRQVVSILDMQYKSHPDDLTWLARQITHALIMLAVRRADRIMAISAFSKNEIMRYARCPPDRIAVTPLGVNPAFALDGNNMPPGVNVPYLLCVANSYPHKNIHTLVEAFGRLVDDIPHSLVMVGRPRLGESLVQQALACVPEDRVIRREGVSPSELIALYQRADAFVFPSLYEGFGLPVLEAMMAGTPVITTREGALPEVCGEHAAYVSGRDVAALADCMQTILADRDEWAKKRRNEARSHAAQFTWESTARQTVQAWRFVLNENPDRNP